MGKGYYWNSPGSVLGPLLFVIFINDLPDEVKYNICKMFADDCKIYGLVENVNLNKLQVDLCTLEVWSKKWQLPFNAEKCKVMHFGKNNPEHYDVLNNHVLEKSEQEKDLGVIIEKKLKFHAHTAAAVKKANQVLGLIKRSYHSRDSYTIKTLYKPMVRPHLEYGNAIWGPNYSGDIKILEKIQRRATKMIIAIKDLHYEERLKELNLPSLVYRRRRGDMIIMYKIMNNLVRIDRMQLFSPPKILTTRGHNKKVLKKHAVAFVRGKSFSQRVINNWNLLPSTIAEAPSLNIFKNRLDEYWKDIWYSMEVS